MRGKHAAAADGRRNATETTRTIESLRSEIAKLTAERDTAQQKSDYWKQRHARDVRQLKQDLEDSTSDELRTSYAAIEAVRRERDAARAQLAEGRKIRDREFDWFVRRCVEDLRLSGAEGIELACQWVGTDAAEQDRVDEHTRGLPPTSIPTGVLSDLGTEGVTRLAMARKERKRPRVTRLSEIRFAWRGEVAP